MTLLCAAIDWSASGSRSPARASPDACWLAWATTGHDPTTRPEPEYFRTRSACRARLETLLHKHRGPAVVGFDFPMGYPVGALGEPVLPAGRALAALLDVLIEDDPATNRNNRFEAACRLNAMVRAATGALSGPLWGHPQGRSYDGLGATRPADCGVREFRQAERLVRARGVQSPWKLAYPASVGSQTLLGMAHVHRLLAHAGIGPRCRIWPFESPRGDPEEIVIAEVWPGLFAHDHHAHQIRDARQVMEVRDRLLADPAGMLRVPGGSEPGAACARVEGWIAGVSLASPPDNARKRGDRAHQCELRCEPRP